MALVNDIHGAEALLWDVLMEVLGADKFHTPPMVRRSWNMNGAPDWKINDDVIFMQLTEDSSDDISQPIDAIIETKGNDFVLREGMTRVLTLSLVAYGSSSYKNLMTLRRVLSRGVRKLRLNKIYPIPSAEPVRRVPENFQGRWWERADTRIKFNCLMVFETDVNRIDEVDVTIKANSPLDSTKVTTSDIIIKKG